MNTGICQTRLNTTKTNHQKHHNLSFITVFLSFGLTAQLISLFLGAFFFPVALEAFTTYRSIGKGH